MGLVKSQTKYVSSISAALAHFQPALLSPLRLVCMQHHTIQAFASDQPCWLAEACETIVLLLWSHHADKFVFEDAEAIEQLAQFPLEAVATGAGKRIWMSEYASGNYAVSDIRTGLDLSVQVVSCTLLPPWGKTSTTGMAALVGTCFQLQVPISCQKL